MNNQELASLILAPIVSEKSSIDAEKNKRFVFKVQTRATKFDIKKSVELMFDVEVDSVQVLNVKGKAKRFGRTFGKRSDWKKAYVKLRAGDSIELVES